MKNVVVAVCKHPAISTVIVVDNGSTDDTAIEAKGAGADVISEPVPGLGRAMKRGIAAATTPYILRTDADISNWNTEWISHLCQKGGKWLARAVFTSSHDEFPVTRLVVRPCLETFVPALANLPLPISGTYLFRSNQIGWLSLPDDWSWDIALVIQAHERGLTIANVDIGLLCDRQRSLSHYEGMAREIYQYFVETYTTPISKA